MDIQTDLNDRERHRYAEMTHILTDVLEQFHFAIINHNDHVAASAFAMFMAVTYGMVGELGPIFSDAADISHRADQEISKTDMEANLRAILEWGKEDNGGAH